MKISTLLLFVSFIIFIASCGKKEIVPEIPAAKAIYPRQYILTKTDNGISVSKLISIKYDTLNFKIEFYFDDSTTATPFDQLSRRLTYNDAGYLAKNEYFTDNSGRTDSYGSYTITRSPDNSISKIVTFEKSPAYTHSTTATVGFSANSSGEEMTVTWQNSNGTTQQKKFYFDNNKLLKNTDLSTLNTGSYRGLTSYVYNTDGTLSSLLNQEIVLTPNNDTVSNQRYGQTLFYNSGFQGGTTDHFKRLFLRKSYNELLMEDYYIFGFSTYPFATSFSITGGGFVTDVDTYKVGPNGSTSENFLTRVDYTLDNEGRLSKSRFYSPTTVTAAYTYQFIY